MAYSDELDELDKVARNLLREGSLKSITVYTPNGYFVERSEEKYHEAAKSGQNPITQIFNVTSSATTIVKSSLSVSQEIQNIVHDLEKSDLAPKKLSEARRNLNRLGSELDKSNPNEKVISKIMRWASNFDLELALRIAVPIAERFLKEGDI